jgi:hypothetical protein
MLALEQIAVNISAEQMGKCTRVVDFQIHEDLYLVESSDGTEDYKVRFDPEMGFTCTCKAGQQAFASCKNYCWHVRASVACWLEEQAYMQELAEKSVSTHNAALPIVIESTHPQELVAVRMSRTEKAMPAWIMNAKPAPHMKKSPKER